MTKMPPCPGVGKVHNMETRQLQSSSEDVPDDLLHLEDFNDIELLRCLKIRYGRHQIFTWVGSVLVSVNPYRDIGVFKEDLMEGYADVTQHTGRPHLFASVAACLAAPGSRHALLISGESGAGKTEATRAALSFLASRCGAAHGVRDRLLHSNPVLEAFGNAKTRQNGNSSRFGKFIEVHISRVGELTGATLRPYMLEASRVAGDLPQAERTYHIFYQLRAALGALAEGTLPPGPLWQKLAQVPEWQEAAHAAARPLVDSRRLAGGPPQAECLKAFEELYERLLGTGMTHKEVAECARIVAAVGMLADEQASLEDLVGTLEVLIGTPETELVWFFSKVESTVGTTCRERFVRCRGEREAETLRASVAQELYAALFAWVTRLVASGVAPPAAAPPGGKRLGLLDLYGFEVFQSNGFEQLLINYCNERIQQLFNRQVFLSEAEDYALEGLDCDGQWQRLTAACQLPALTLLQGEPGGFAGIFGVVNDHSRIGFETCGDGGAVAEAVAVSCGSHPAFRRSARDSARVFGVAHFAGEVFYEARHFVRKNASSHRPDIVAFLRRHGGSFVRQLFAGETAADTCTSGASLVADAANVGSDDGDAPGRRRLMGTTLISAFRAELNELCEALEERECRHIRCLRPNDSQVPLFFDDPSMLRQCRYSGLLEATRIRRYGFAHRRTLAAFSSRYRVVLPGACRRSSTTANACRAICEVMRAAGLPGDAARSGRTKVFLQEAALTWLEDARIEFASARVTAGAHGWHARRHFRRIRQAAIRITRTASRWHARRRVARHRWAVLRAQALIRGFIARREAQRRHWQQQMTRGYKEELSVGVPLQTPARSPRGAPSPGTKHRSVLHSPNAMCGAPERRPGRIVRPSSQKENAAPCRAEVMLTADGRKQVPGSPPQTAGRRQVLTALSSPNSPERTKDRLQVQLAQVGRALRAGRITADQLERTGPQMEGLLDNLLNVAKQHAGYGNQLSTPSGWHAPDKQVQPHKKPPAGRVPRPAASVVAHPGLRRGLLQDERSRALCMRPVLEASNCRGWTPSERRRAWSMRPHRKPTASHNSTLVAEETTLSSCCGSRPGSPRGQQAAGGQCFRSGIPLGKTLANIGNCY